MVMPNAFLLAKDDAPRVSVGGKAMLFFWVRQ
jgi:hypothetical protein